MKLFMVMLGCRPESRLTEQHDVFFGIAGLLSELAQDMKMAWPDSGKLHIDAWREINAVNGYAVHIEPRPDASPAAGKSLYFINLGGYKPNEFDEFHYKVLAVADSIQEAAKAAKQTSFFRHTGFENAVAHIDDRYGIDVDEIVNLTDILDEKYKRKFRIVLEKKDGLEDDELHLGYLPLEKL